MSGLTRAVAFLAAQLHGARIAFSLCRKYRKKASEDRTVSPIVAAELPKLAAHDGDSTPADEKADTLADRTIV